ncbi:MAG: hypothetical protein LUF29_09940 [Oscillospiraceae bacterium]|nr:hypothetical protein [Oscillospiraceae bacterium]
MKVITTYRQSANRNRRITDNLHYLQKFKKFLIPSMISMALLAVYTFTNSFVIGQKLGSTALGAMGICTPVITLTYAFGYLFGKGGAALYSISLFRTSTSILCVINLCKIFASLCERKMKIQNPLDSIIIMEFKIIRIAYNKEDTV